MIMKPGLAKKSSLLEAFDEMKDIVEFILSDRHDCFSADYSLTSPQQLAEPELRPDRAPPSTRVERREADIP